MKNRIFAILILTLLISAKSFSCTCPNPKSIKAIQDYEFENSDCVFVGEVLEVNMNDNTFKIKVIESFKGKDKETIYIGTYDEQCGPIIDEKGKWLVYARFNSENILKINECGLTRSLKNPEYNNVIDGLIEKRLNESDKTNQNKFNLEARKILELELSDLRKNQND